MDSKKIICLCILGILLINNPLSAQTKVIAHRGYWDTEGSAQNSITSLNKAYEAGAYGSEFDVILTKDNVPVINHDSSIQGFEIENTNYKTLKNLKLKNGEKLPTLSQYLAQGKKNKPARLILEIKPHKTPEAEKRAAKIIVEMVNRMKVSDLVEYISFSLFICKEVHHLSPESPVAYLDGTLSPAELKAIGLTGLDYNQNVLKKKPEWIQEAKQLGLTVNVWTVNDLETMQTFVNQQVDFITTDKPVELKKLLQQ